MAPMKAGDTVAAVIDGTVRTLTFEEWQYVEPSNYCHEAGAWCVSDEDDNLYFVSEDGRVDLHDADTFACIRESAGLTQKAHDAYWEQQARQDEIRREFEHERDYDRRKYGP